ncbi:hypothetical protein [Sulfuricurvum sp.]|uniref:hypothetical protein n=1 Tax=Sulfuricurvum sp. TaxID=2025608 RepID=UPI003562F262
MGATSTTNYKREWKRSNAELRRCCYFVNLDMRIYTLFVTDARQRFPRRRSVVVSSYDDGDLVKGSLGYASVQRILKW